MARPTLFGHRKFRALARQLNSKALAVGTLELLWHVANDSGDPVLGSTEDVEDIADWRGTPGALTGMLVSCGFLDALEGGVYEVHDHEHHRPQYVKRRCEREQQRRRATDAPLTGQQSVTDVPLASTPISHLPSPITPHLEEQELSPPAAPQVRAFDAFYAIYPFKIAKGAAERAYDKALKLTTPDVILAAVRAQMSHLTRENKKYRLHPATWLNQERWQDDVMPAESQSVSAAEYAKAEKYRQASWGRCPHDPKCGQYADCVNAIAVELRTATGAA